MKYLPRVLSLFIILIGCYAAAAQSDWHTYQKRSMATIIADTPLESEPKATFVISGALFPSRTVLVFQGKKRPIEGESRRFIDLWFQARNIAQDTKAPLTTEYLFKEKEREFWMPVVPKILPHLEKELKTGDEIMAYYFFLGGYDAAKAEQGTDKETPLIDRPAQIEWVFLFEEFDKPAYSQAVQFAGLQGMIIDQPFTETMDKKLERGIRATARDLMDPRQIKSRSNVTFTGQTRPTTTARLLLIDRWGQAHNMTALSAIMTNEALFRLGDKDYWLPVRQAILDEMQTKLKAGTQISIQTMTTGFVRAGDTADWVFMVGDYAAAK